MKRCRSVDDLSLLVSTVGCTADSSTAGEAVEGGETLSENLFAASDDRAADGCSPQQASNSSSGSNSKALMRNGFLRLKEKVPVDKAVEWPSIDSPVRSDSNRFVSIVTGCILQQLPTGRLPAFWRVWKVDVKQIQSSGAEKTSSSAEQQQPHLVLGATDNLYKPLETDGSYFAFASKDSVGELRPGPRNQIHYGNGSLKPFSIMSFNILAEIYTTQEAFPYCEAYSLAWAYRKGRILDTILESEADIVCLQVGYGKYRCGRFK